MLLRQSFTDIPGDGDGSVLFHHHAVALSDKPGGELCFQSDPRNQGHSFVKGVDKGHHGNEVCPADLHFLLPHYVLFSELLQLSPHTHPSSWAPPLPQCTKVAVTTLDDLLPDIAARSIFVLKIDIEGQLPLLSCLCVAVVVFGFCSRLYVCCDELGLFLLLDFISVRRAPSSCKINT